MYNYKIKYSLINRHGDVKRNNTVYCRSIVEGIQIIKGIIEDTKLTYRLTGFTTMTPTALITTSAR